jgi:hypothetical protein
MSNALNMTEKRAKLQIKGQQKKSNGQDVGEIDTELNSGTESARELHKKQGTGG